VERSKRVGNSVESTTVVSKGVALAEVVGLSLGVVTTNPFPVELELSQLVHGWSIAKLSVESLNTYLVKIIGLENSRGNDTLTSSGLDNDIDTAEEDVLAGADSRGLSSAADGEDSAVAVVAEGGTRERIERAA
jgi:hypothetical protein